MEPECYLGLYIPPEARTTARVLGLYLMPEVLKYQPYAYSHVCAGWGGGRGDDIYVCGRSCLPIPLLNAQLGQMHSACRRPALHTCSTSSTYHFLAISSETRGQILIFTLQSSHMFKIYWPDIYSSVIEMIRRCGLVPLSRLEKYCGMSSLHLSLTSRKSKPNICTCYETTILNLATFQLSDFLKKPSQPRTSFCSYVAYSAGG